VSRLDSKSTRPAGILIRRPRTTIYTVLLGIALAAIVIACLLLFIELNRYDYFWHLPWKARVS
jgi:hypothetical protein